MPPKAPATTSRDVVRFQLKTNLSPGQTKEKERCHWDGRLDAESEQHLMTALEWNVTCSQ